MITPAKLREFLDQVYALRQAQELARLSNDPTDRAIVRAVENGFDAKLEQIRDEFGTGDPVVDVLEGIVRQLATVALAQMTAGSLDGPVVQYEYVEADEQPKLVKLIGRARALYRDPPLTVVEMGGAA